MSIDKIILSRRYLKRLSLYNDNYVNNKPININSFNYILRIVICGHLSLFKEYYKKEVKLKETLKMLENIPKFMYINDYEILDNDNDDVYNMILNNYSIHILFEKQNHDYMFTSHYKDLSYRHEFTTLIMDYSEWMSSCLDVYEEEAKNCISFIENINEISESDFKFIENKKYIYCIFALWYNNIDMFKYLIENFSIRLTSIHLYDILYFLIQKSIKNKKEHVLFKYLVQSKMMSNFITYKLINDENRFNIIPKSIEYIMNDLKNASFNEMKNYLNMILNIKIDKNIYPNINVFILKTKNRHLLMRKKSIPYC